MKNTGNIALIVCIALVIYIIADKLGNSQANKIGVVQMEKLVYDYKGMKEASQSYTEKVKQWGGESDSMEVKLKNLYDMIRMDSVSKDENKLNRDIKTFMLMKQSYMEYSQRMQQKAQDEDKQMTIGVINQLNDHIKAFAKKEGFDVILCSNAQTQQSVGYAKEQIDVTQKLLDFANNAYEGTNK